jgi:nitroreductase
LGLCDDRIVVCGISLGYADLDHPINEFRATRAPLREVVTRLTE